MFIVIFGLMFFFSHKSKQKLLLLLRVLVLALAFGYIYFKIVNTPTNVWTYLEQFKYREKLFKSVFIFSFLASLNWFFEILKWKTLASYITLTSITKATKESLASLLVSLATPNRIGEYGAKALYYPPQQRKQILALTLIGNVLQMATTVFFGSAGFVYCLYTFNVNVNKTTLVSGVILFASLIVVLYYFRKKEWFIKGVSFQNLVHYFYTFPNTKKIQVLTFSIVRYFIFSYLFYILLVFFGASISLFTALPIIFTMYFFTSIIPTIAIFDVAVKGSIAVWLFSFLGVPEISVLCTVLIMWLLNVVIPASIGSIFVAQYKPQFA